MVMKPSPDSRSWKFASFLIRAAKVLEMTSQLDLGYMPILKAVTGEGNRPFCLASLDGVGSATHTENGLNVKMLFPETKVNGCWKN